MLKAYLVDTNYSCGPTNWSVHIDVWWPVLTNDVKGCALIGDLYYAWTGTNNSLQGILRDGNWETNVIR